MRALLWEAVTLISSYACNSSFAPRDFDRLMSEYRITQTAVLAEPYGINNRARQVLVLHRKGYRAGGAVSLFSRPRRCARGVSVNADVSFLPIRMV